MVEQDPFRTLLNIANNSKALNRPLPSLAEASMWVGLGVQMGNERFVIPLSELAEVMLVGEVTPIPGMQSWVRGIAALRAELMVVSDLHDMLKIRRGEIGEDARLLVVQDSNTFYGLVVDSIFGLKHVAKEKVQTAAPEVATVYLPYIQGHFVEGPSRIWPIFSVTSLIRSPAFKRVRLSN